MGWQDREAPLTIAFGGGLNSTALLILLHQKGIVPDVITFADTGGERPETYAHLKAMQEWCKKVGFPDIVVVVAEEPYKTLEEAMLARKELPSKAYGNSFCSNKWKVRPQNKYLKKWLMDRFLYAHGNQRQRPPLPWKLLGFDGGELYRAARNWEDGVCRYAFPLIEWEISRQKCLEVCRDAGFPNVSKSACFYCPSMPKSDVIKFSQTHPDLFARALEIERNALESGTVTTMKGLGRAWSWAELIACSDAERANLREKPVESCIVCDDDSSED